MQALGCARTRSDMPTICIQATSRHGVILYICPLQALRHNLVHARMTPPCVGYCVNPWFLHVRGDKSNIRIHACCTRHSCFFHVWRDMPTMWMCVVSGPICCSHSQQQQVREETCCEQADSCDCSFQQNKTKRPTTHINATSMYGAAWHQCFLRVLVRGDKSTYASLQLHVCGGRAPRSSMCEWQGTCPLRV